MYKFLENFLDGPVAKTLSSNVGDLVSIPGQEIRFQKPN